MKEFACYGCQKVKDIQYLGKDEGNGIMWCRDCLKSEKAEKPKKLDGLPEIPKCIDCGGDLEVGVGGGFIPGELRLALMCPSCSCCDINLLITGDFLYKGHGINETRFERGKQISQELRKVVASILQRFLLGKVQGISDTNMGDTFLRDLPKVSKDVQPGYFS